MMNDSKLTFKRTFKVSKTLNEFLWIVLIIAHICCTFTITIAETMLQTQQDDVLPQLTNTSKTDRIAMTYRAVE